MHNKQVVYKTTINKSLHRKSLVLGGDRELVLLSAIFALTLGIGGKTIPTIIAAILFWIVALILLRKLAKKDPLMFHVWRKHRKHEDVYLARSTPWRK